MDGAEPGAVDLGWAELDRVVAVLAGQVRADGLPEVVLGARAGDEPAAALLARQLGVRLLYIPDRHPGDLHPRHLRSAMGGAGAAGSDAPSVPAPRTAGAVPAAADATPCARVSSPGDPDGVDGVDALDVLVVDTVAGRRTGQWAVGTTGARPARVRHAALVIDLDAAPATDAGPDSWSTADYIGTACRCPRFPWQAAT